MRRSLLAFALAALLASPAAAQVPYATGPTNQSSLALIAPTAPTAANNNQIATTAWVNNLVNAGLPLASGKIWIGSVGGIATPQTPSGDLTVSNGGVFTFGTVNANVGSFGSVTQCATFTVNAKGLVTAASQNVCTPAIASVTGLGTGVATALGVNVGSAGAFVTFNGALGTPSSGNAANLTTFGTNVISRANLAQGVARSVIGVAGNATANDADIQGTTANTFLGVNAAGNGLAFQSLRQIIPLTMGTVPLAQATTNFTISLGNATESLVQSLCPIGGTFKNLFIQSTAPAAGQTLTATWRVNNADTALTCTVTGTGTTCNDTTHTAACTAGQTYSLKLVTSATTGSLASIAGGVEFDSP